MTFTSTARGYRPDEMAAAANRLVTEVLEIAAGHIVAITADTEADERVVNAVANAVSATGGIPVVMWYSTHDHSHLGPPRPITAAILASDVWIEFAVAYSMYSDTWQRAISAGVQFCEYDGLDADGLIRCFGQHDVRLLDAFGDELCSLFSDRGRVRVTTARGTDLEMSNASVQVGVFAMKANPRRTSIVLPGQVSWSPIANSVHGRIVVDGILFPPAKPGFAEDPVELTVNGGRVVDIRGGRSASRLREWTVALEDDAIYRIAHVSLGFHPGIRTVIGRVAEEERAFGSIDFGWGAWIDRPARGHFDGSVLAATCWVDDELVLEHGRYVHSRLADLCSLVDVDPQDGDAMR